MRRQHGLPRARQRHGEPALCGRCYNRIGNFTQADIGTTARAVTDNEVAKTSTNNIVVGTVVELLDGNRVRIRIDNHTV